MLLSMVGDESSDAAKHKEKKEFEELTFRVGKKYGIGYVAIYDALW